MDALEMEESRVLLELKTLREGLWKLTEFAAFAKNLVCNVSYPLRALLKLSSRAHPSIQAYVVDLLQYKPKLLVQADAVAPKPLGMGAEP